MRAVVFKATRDVAVEDVPDARVDRDDDVVVRAVRGQGPVRAFQGGTKTATGTKHRPGQTWRARMTERLEERWRRRQQGNGGMPGRTRS